MLNGLEKIASQVMLYSSARTGYARHAPAGQAGRGIAATGRRLELHA